MKHPHTPLTRTLEGARMGLLRLHKKLLDVERARYEREHGRIENGSALLQLVINDPFFAWLRRLSELVVEIDERLEGEEPMPDDNARALLTQIRGMLTTNPEGDAFQRNYDRALQESPDVVIAHVEVVRVLDSAPSDR
jgi:hypothetical protein